MTSTVPTIRDVENRRWIRYGAAAGFVFVLLELVGGLLFIPTRPSLDSSAQEISQYFEDNRRSIQVGMLIILVGLLFWFWFLGALHDHLRRAEGGSGWLSAVALGSGLITGALVIISSPSLQRRRFAQAKRPQR